jgi:excisionase family DNA binding protein
MEQIEGKNYLTIREVMERLGISRSTVQRYVTKGKVEYIELRGMTYITEDSYKMLFIPKSRKVTKDDKK